MSIITRMRKQKAVYWKRTSPNKYGQFSYEAPVEVDCRWDGMAMEFMDSQGSIQVSKHVVYPDREMSIGDKLQQGELDSNTPDDPEDRIDAHEIRQFAVTPNFRATENLYTAYL